MTRLRVEFRGICTHVKHPFAGDDWPHRVVLPVNKDPQLPEHTASLWIPTHAVLEPAIEEFANACRLSCVEKEQHYVLTLAGVELDIENAFGSVDYDATYFCGIFSLQHYSHAHLEPNYAVIRGRHKTDVAAHFNVTAGHFWAKLVGEGASVAVLELRTTAHPVLRASNFEGGTGRLKLRPDSSIKVQNIGEEEDRKDDFFIHYQVVKPYVKPGRPDKPAPCLGPPPDPSERTAYGGVNLSVGCSNSTFP